MNSRLPRVCYVLGSYISHHRAGEAYRDCLERIGVQLVDRPADADLVVLHNEPWAVAGYFRSLPELRQRKVVAYCVWETDKLPERYADNLRLVDEIWTCSTYCRDVLATAGPPVRIVPHVVRPEAPSEDDRTWIREHVKRSIGADEGDGVVNFYTIAPLGNPRKALPELLQAFDGLLPTERARMIVKSTRPLPPELAQISGVVELPAALTDARIAALHEIGDVFVSAHRSEGWGLGISEAMANGNLVVATAHGGNMDFMDDRNSLPVACSVEPIRKEDVLRQSALLSSDMRWGYVDSDDLRKQIRRAADEWRELEELRQRAREAMQRFSPPKVAEVIRALLADQ